MEKVNYFINLFADDVTVDTDSFIDMLGTILVPLLNIMSIMSVAGGALYFLITWIMYVFTQDEEAKEEKLNKFKKSWIPSLIAVLIGVAGISLFSAFMAVFGYDFSFS